MRRPLVAFLIALFIAIVIGAASYFLLVGPKKGQVNEKQKQIEETENKIQTEQITYKKLQDIKNRSAEYEARLASLQSMIPEGPELPTLIRNIQAAADVGTGAGLPWMSFTPGELTAGGGLSSYSFDMIVGGFYYEVVDLIYRLESMQRAVVISNVTINSTTSILEMEYSPNLGLVEATITAETFTFSEAAGGTQPQETTPSTEPTEEESSEEELVE